MGTRPAAQESLPPSSNYAKPVQYFFADTTHRNCAFHPLGHKAILSPESEKVSVLPSKATAPGINALPYLLLPLAGPEELDIEVSIPDSLSQGY